MFGILNDLAKAAVGVALLPVEAVADAVTLGGALTDKKEPYTVHGVKQVMQNLKNAVTPD